MGVNFDELLKEDPKRLIKLANEKIISKEKVFDLVKYQAKQIKKLTDIKYCHALEAVSKNYGFKNLYAFSKWKDI
jgi:choline kinase